MVPLLILVSVFIASKIRISLLMTDVGICLVLGNVPTKVSSYAFSVFQSLKCKYRLLPVTFSVSSGVRH